ncbi:hypothetical protein SAMN04488023_1609 [Pedobacter rhizosphaerae]|uniref:Uncharacterized protein n=1 Tax=Pedobacter rhizosphaerae TaxID=390241 RepID=A0A1H9W796_9SPHI|nr:hypothetical protein SAMN04488023_1609 [Pedobacter rhizosphaerae]
MIGIKGMLNIQRHNVYLTGNSIKSFYKLQPKRFYKLDLGKFNNYKDKVSDLKYSEPLEWNLVFVRGSLKSYYIPKIK